MKKKQDEMDAKVREILPQEVCSIIAATNGIAVHPPEFAVKYRFYITSGNHGNLVRSIIKSREGWTKTEKLERANFVWTQGRKKDYFS